MKGFKASESLFTVVLLIGVFAELSSCLNLPHIRSELAKGGRHVCPYCWACAHSWNCDRPCRPSYRNLCPLCAYRFHCTSTCVNVCPFPESTLPPTTTPAPTTPEPTTPEPTTPEPTTPEPTTPEPTTPEPENDACSPNPCPFDGICQRSSSAAGGYTCSCPPTLATCTEASMNVFQKYDYSRHGPSEVGTSLANPLTALEFNSIYEDTFEELRGLNIPGIHNGEQDALRHALTNYRWTQAENAGLAKKFGDAHERSNPNAFSEMAMDLHNNAMGRQLAEDPANAGRDPLEVVREAFSNGTLQPRPNPNHSQQEDVSDEY